jgi:hypothetical protein
MYKSEDFQEINDLNPQPTENSSSYSVLINGEARIFVPNEMRWACFWAAHFPLHHGQVYTAQTNRQQNLY